MGSLLPPLSFLLDWMMCLTSCSQEEREWGKQVPPRLGLISSQSTTSPVYVFLLRQPFSKLFRLQIPQVAVSLTSRIRPSPPFSESFPFTFPVYPHIHHPYHFQAPPGPSFLTGSQNPLPSSFGSCL